MRPDRWRSRLASPDEITSTSISLALPHFRHETGHLELRPPPPKRAGLTTFLCPRNSAILVPLPANGCNSSVCSVVFLSFTFFKKGSKPALNLFLPRKCLVAPQISELVCYFHVRSTTHGRHVCVIHDER
jgi:hypothetical protein